MSDLVAKLRYMGRQYAAGQYARGGGERKHYLVEAADELESLSAQVVQLRGALAELVAADDGLRASQKAWVDRQPTEEMRGLIGYSTSQTVQIPDPEMHAASERLGSAWAAARAALQESKETK